MTSRLLLLTFVLASPATLPLAQNLGSLDQVPAKARQYIAYTAEPQVVSAGRRSVLELHFHVLDGFHVNSHTPKSDLLIPTRLDVEPAADVKVEPAEYPPGKPYSFTFDPANKLDVYADDFTLRLPVVAQASTQAEPRELHGVLHYQACDKALCYPPRSLPVSVVFSAR